MASMIAQSSASKTSLLRPRRKRSPAHAAGTHLGRYWGWKALPGLYADG